MNISRGWRWTLVFALAVVAGSLSAQHRESVTVEVVDVPVYVSREGEPVRDLTRDDFELYVNGKRREIEYFDVSGDAAAPAARDARLRERRLFVLLFDLAFTPTYNAARAHKAAVKLIDEAGPLDYFAIATFAPADGLRYTLPFTNDKKALRTAMRQFTSRRTYDPLSLVPAPVMRADRVPNEPVDPEDEEEPQADWTDAHSQSVTSDPSKEAMITPRGARDAELRSRGNDVRGLLAGLGALATNLTRLEGQKHVLLMSEGFDATVLNDGRAMLKQAPGLYMQKILEQVFHAYHAAGVFLHTLDPAGIRDVREGPTAASLSILASGTGGEAVNDRNDLHAALSDLTRAYSHGYVLGFRPAGARKGENRIVVKVKRDGVSVTHRRGFSTEAASNAMSGLYLADIVLNDVPQTGLVPVMEINRGAVRARIPMRELAAQLGDEGHAELLVYLFD
ncbi:MAG: VWA domain-containing protein, partial [Thermoanaerobaculia bacterium]